MVQEADYVRLHISGVPRGTSERDLKALLGRAVLEPAGGSGSSSPEVAGVEVMRDSTTGVERGFAFCSVKRSSVDQVIATYSGCKWKGSKLRVAEAKGDYWQRLMKEWEDAAKIKTESEGSTTNEEQLGTEELKRPVPQGMRKLIKAGFPSRILRIRKRPGEPPMLVDPQPYTSTSDPGASSRLNVREHPNGQKAKPRKRPRVYKALHTTEFEMEEGGWGKLPQESQGGVQEVECQWSEPAEMRESDQEEEGDETNAVARKVDFSASGGALNSQIPLSAKAKATGVIKPDYIDKQYPWAEDRSESESDTDSAYKGGPGFDYEAETERETGRARLYEAAPQEEDVGDVLDREKSRALEILAGMFGGKHIMDKQAKDQQKQQERRGLYTVERYDPTKEDAKDLEVEEKQPTEEEQSSEQTSDEGEQGGDEGEQQERAVVEEAARVHMGQLTDIFKVKDKKSTKMDAEEKLQAKGFKLTSLFDDDESGSDDGVDDQGGDEDGDGKDTSQDRTCRNEPLQQAHHATETIGSSQPTSTATPAAPAAPSILGLWRDLSALEAVGRQFVRAGTLEEIEADWLQRRKGLTLDFKRKHKTAVKQRAARATGGGRKKKKKR